MPIRFPQLKFESRSRPLLAFFLIFKLFRLLTKKFKFFKAWRLTFRYKMCKCRSLTSRFNELLCSDVPQTKQQLYLWSHFSLVIAVPFGNCVLNKA